MGKVANDAVTSSPVLPDPAVVADAPALGPGGAQAVLGYGLTVAEVLESPCLTGSSLLAGKEGLGRLVQRLNVMEVPDILPWVKPYELLLTTGYPLRNNPEQLTVLLAELDARGLSAVAVKLGRYLDELPPTMLTAADELGIPVIQLPGHISFDDVISQVLTDILNRQSALLARTEQVHHALVQIVLDGGGLQEVTDELVRLLDGPVCVTDPGGRVLAASGQVPANLAALLHGRAGLRRYGEVEIAVVRIVAGSLDHGRIVAVPGDRELTSLDVQILERAATVAALVITKQLAVAAVEARYQGDFLRDILSERGGGSADAIRGHAASLGWDVDRPLAVLVAELDDLGGGNGSGRAAETRRAQERLAAAWVAALRARDPRTAVVGYSQEVVALVAGTSDPVEAARQLAATVTADLTASKHSFSVGVSRVVGHTGALPDGYEQARQALRVGKKMHGRGTVVGFDELGVYRLLSLVPDGAELRSFVRETLGQLAENDDAETKDLRHTLQVLLDTNLNVAETARALHYHYNTLRYRIGKLERMLGPFTTDAHLRLNLALALQVIQMRGI
ncbi:MAG TPA: PucR family transcriptional regulator ligand-binding domain-containing protein [Actinomycetes bacterium]|nr:PucR family transcriptional regulator ligand-binding domain-containing protein [Actinomycetes bacterium]